MTLNRTNDTFNLTYKTDYNTKKAVLTDGELRMTRILNFGSMNIDYVYQVNHFVKPGETVSSDSLLTNCGGKGLNQSVALARAGAKVFHAGKIGAEGVFLKEYLESCGVDTSYVLLSDEHTGHAIIEVDAAGENAILLFGGANHSISEAEIDKVLAHFGEGDILLLQNEISNIPYIMRRASEKKMRIFINPAPMNAAACEYPLELAECIFLNEIEASQLANMPSIESSIEALEERYPMCMLVFTLGEHGVVCRHGGRNYQHGIYSVKVADTTAAGDTFTGFFTVSVAQDGDIEKALKIASKASAITVTREGASKSIPTRDEVEHFRFS